MRLRNQTPPVSLSAGRKLRFHADDAVFPGLDAFAPLAWVLL
jgi:hypothetical protein